MTLFELDNEDMEEIPVSPLPVEDEAALFQAISLILKSGGWGKITISLKNGKIEDIDTTISKRLRIERKNH